MALESATEELKKAEDELAQSRSKEGAQLRKLKKQTDSVKESQKEYEESLRQTVKEMSFRDLGKQLKKDLLEPFTSFLSSIPKPLKTLGMLAMKPFVGSTKSANVGPTSTTTTETVAGVAKQQAVERAAEYVGFMGGTETKQLENIFGELKIQTGVLQNILMDGIGMSGSDPHADAIAENMGRKDFDPGVRFDPDMGKGGRWREYDSDAKQMGNMVSGKRAEELGANKDRDTLSQTDLTAARLDEERRQSSLLEQVKNGIMSVVTGVRDIASPEQDASKDAEQQLEKDTAGGTNDMAGPKKGGIFGKLGKAFKKVTAFVKKFLKWKTMIVFLLGSLLAGLAIKYWEPIKEFVVDNILPALKWIGGMLMDVATAVWGWIGSTGLPVAIDFVIAQFNSIKELADNVVARFEGWNSMDFKDKLFAILGVFSDLGTYVMDTARNMWVGILGLFGLNGEALAKKYFDPIRNAISGIVDWIVLAFTDPGAALSKLWKGLFGETGIFAWMWDDGIKPFFTWIGEKFVGMGKAIAEKWNTAFPDGILSWIWDNTIGALYTFAKDFLSPIATSIATKWNEAFPDGILSWIWDNTLGALYTFAKDFFGPMATSIATKWNEIFPNGIFAWIWDNTIGGLYTWATEKIGNMGDAIAAVWKETFGGDGILGWIWDNTFGGLYTWATNHLGNVGDSIAEKWNQQFPNGIAAYIYDNTIGGLVDWFKELANIDFGAVFTKMISKLPGAQNIMDFFGFGGSSKKTESFDKDAYAEKEATLNAITMKQSNLRYLRDTQGLNSDGEQLLAQLDEQWLKVHKELKSMNPSLDPVVVTALRPTNAEASAALSGNQMGGPGVDGVAAPVVASFGGATNSQDFHFYSQAPAGASDGHTAAQKRIGIQGRFAN